MSTLPALSVQHAAFLDEYLKDGNGTRAYMVAYPKSSAKAAETSAYALLRKPQIESALAARRADIAARNGITLDALINVLKIQAFTPISEVLGDPRYLPPDKALAVESYRAATAQTAEVTKIADRRGAVLELWDRLFPDQGKAAPEAGGNDNRTQVHIDKLLVQLRAIEPKGAA